MEELKIEYIEIDKLNHFEDNSKIHTKEQIAHIANSIKQYGFNDPLGITKDNVILEGNGRVEAAKLIGIKKLPCVRLDHLSTEEQKAYVIAHNSTNLETGFDDGILFQQLKELQDNYDFTNYGIDIDKYLKTCIRVQKRLLKPNKKVHYLISLDINKNDEIATIIEKIKTLEGVEIESTTN